MVETLWFFRAKKGKNASQYKNEEFCSWLWLYNISKITVEKHLHKFSTSNIIFVLLRKIKN